MKAFNIRGLGFIWNMCLFVAVVQGQGVFTDRTSELGLKLGNGPAACVDFDNDGWADIYCSGALWKNNQGKDFSKVFDKGGSAVWADFDNDGYPDMFVYSSRQLFRNESGKDMVLRPFPKLSIESSRGTSWADYNGDGYVDLYIGGYENWQKGVTYPDTVLLNRQGKTWEKVSSDARYRARGVTSCDFDNDGDVDVYVSNYRLQPNLLWRNDGTGKFTDATASHNAAATWSGFAGGHSIGAAWADFDNDGDIDLVTAGKLFINRGNTNGWVKVKLRGDGKRVNRDAIGSQVRIKLKDKILTRQVEAGTGEGNQNEMTLHFGLGNHKDSVDLEIVWAGGLRQTLSEIKPNRLITVTFDLQAATK